MFKYFKNKKDDIIVYLAYNLNQSRKNIILQYFIDIIAAMYLSYNINKFKKIINTYKEQSECNFQFKINENTYLSNLGSRISYCVYNNYTNCHIITKEIQESIGVGYCNDKLIKYIGTKIHHREFESTETIIKLKYPFIFYIMNLVVYNPLQIIIYIITLISGIINIIKAIN